MCGVLCCALLALSDVYSLIFRPREWGVQTNCSSAPNSANNSWQISGKCTKSSTQSERRCILSREEAAPQQGGTSQDLRIALTHIKHSINQTAVFHFLCLQYPARMVISWLITWEIPPQTFEINLLSSYLTEETWGPCQWSSVWWDLKIFIREWR